MAYEQMAAEAADDVDIAQCINFLKATR